MSKFCPNCGTELVDEAVFCASCGAPQPAAESANAGQTQQQYQSGAGFNLAAIKKKDLVVAILLSIVTCGIYSLIWMAELNDEMYQVFNEPIEKSGGMVVLLCIITCGIYGWFWYYRMGERTDRLKGAQGSNSILFIVLAIFGLGIVNLAIMQDALNKCAEQ